jgi:serine/threonine protein kinase
MTLPSGAQLGPYRIVELIGSGGMGVVYRAHDARLGRDVALKVVSDALDAQPEAAARFEQEARAAAALSHPNIVAIHDVGQVDGRPYAVTELLEGESLRARMSRGPLEWREAVEIALATADGLAAAHARGIVHRDIKPENLFVTRDGHLKILDFGLARTQLPPAPAEAPTRALTEAGLIVGTIGYLSPEQVRGEVVGPPSDVFALGCVLYEMITGRRAFEGATTVDRLAAVLRASPTPIAAEQAPADAVRIVDRCLEKAPEQRFAQGRELAEALQALLSESGARRALGRPKAARARVPRSLAVLPFELTPANPEAEFLGEGLAESIINNLSALPRLRVVPRSTVIRYKGRGLDVGAVGRELGATSVLAGHLTWRADMLKLQVELVDPVSDAQVWGQRYTRRVDDIFVLQEALARDISEALELRLTTPTKRRIARRATVDADAYLKKDWIAPGPASRAR